MTYDRIIIGAGLYGLYAARYCGRKKEHVLVLEYDPEPFMRATYINQARVHMGYHYPRSYTTAVKSAGYFKRFNDEFGFCIHSGFDQVYATSSCFSWTDAGQFQKFCDAAGIRCDEIPASRYFKPGMCDGAFLTEEYTYDAQILKKALLDELSAMSLVTLKFGARISDIKKESGCFNICVSSGESYSSGFVLNASYASVNQILRLLGDDPFPIKYELCEIILCDVDDSLKGTGITVMDGPFFSIMPFGKTGLHSLTSVTFTPHMTSYDHLPSFPCMKKKRERAECSPGQLGNCGECPERPESAWDYMSHLTKKYLKDEYGFRYRKSLFSMKPILKASEIDDSRPTVIRYSCKNPDFISVLSGKINTVYDLDEVLG